LREDRRRDAIIDTPLFKIRLFARSPLMMFYQLPTIRTITSRHWFVTLTDTPFMPRHLPQPSRFDVTTRR